MVREHQTVGDSEGQGSLVCYSPWGRKESDTTESLNNDIYKTTVRLAVSHPKFEIK